MNFSTDWVHIQDLGPGYDAKWWNNTTLMAKIAWKYYRPKNIKDDNKNIDLTFLRKWTNQNYDYKQIIMKKIE